ncbi:T9SS type A sorting domain-containing protein [Psychroserpens sp. SPM9]|uniref:T9SS type A sorting domain-containing protein n=1 Tax=Psychroserpens sp. SPM9 TaxID=2975598 RepID=UPI0021A29111|nr:T9SS type A sorting domain-containing protein [Psychroserpens sp. SPM9]MDG5491182.1 T9SS type A sorting domain-containing protein [Psychroserpens sp. SPM9]
MKKITFYFIMLLSMTAFSQIEVNENFEEISNNQVPAGWTETNFGATSNFTCDASEKAVATFFMSAGEETLTTPNYAAISNGTDLTVSFSYNIFEQVSQFPPPSFVAPATDWGSIVLQYSTNNGTSWTDITTIDDSNYNFVDTANCGATASINVGPIANGSDFQARFVVTTATVSNFALWVIIDNVSFTQTATTAPNCDVTLISPANGSDTADADVSLVWQAATGLPTGYTVSVGTTSGGTDIVNGATTTETNYALTDLEYETEYFVNIVPYNGIGSATGCVEESFTTRMAPIPGATCSSPIVLSLPYFELGGDTDNYEDNIDTSPCSNTYMRGKDVFYEITPTTDVSINIEVENISNTGASIHVVNGCPDAATECVAYVGTFSGNTRSLTEVVLLSGNTYFIVLSNTGNTSTYTYDLIITENDCINPTIGALTPVADCDNDQFFVDVDITYLGDATSLTLSDDDGTTADITNITSTGIVTAGPYASGTVVNFSLTNDQNNECFFSDSTFFYCPPSNDDCGDAINLTVNTDDTCTILTNASNAGATESAGDLSSCSSTNTNDVWFSFVATEEIIILEYLNLESAPGFPAGGIFQSTELLSGDCGTLTSLACYTSSYVTFTNLTIGNTYYIRNKTNLGSSQQNFDICLREAPAAPANDECANAVTLTTSTDDSCDNQVFGTTIGATLSSDNACNTDGYGDVWYVYNPTVSGVYEFSLERLSTTPSTYFSVYEGTCGSLVEKTTSCNSNSNQILTLDSTLTYYVMVQSNQNGEGIDFNLCVWQLPDAVVNSDCASALTLTESVDMNGNNSISSNINVTDVAYYSPEGCAGTSSESVWYELTPQYTGTYHFNFTRDSGSASYTVYNTDDCSQTDTASYVTGISSCFNNTTPRTGELVAGNTYLILVHASSAAEFTLFAYPDESLSVASNDFNAFKYYPNPVENTLTIDAQNTISMVTVHNILGQSVKTKMPNNLETTIDMSAMEKGIYFVTVKINNSQKTFKIIKE